MNEDIRTVLDVVAAISRYIYVASKEVAVKIWDRRNCRLFDRRNKQSLTKDAEELVQYILQDEDYY